MKNETEDEHNTTKVSLQNEKKKRKKESGIFPRCET